MVSRRAGLLGGAAVLLAAPSSTTLSSVDLSTLSLNNLFNNSGGAIKASLEEKYSNDELNVENNVLKVGISKHDEIISPEVKEVSESIDLSQQERVNDKNSVDTVKTTYKEVDKEEKTIQLDGESESKYKVGKSKANKYLKEYLSGRDKMYAFDAITSSTGSRRKRRSAPKQITYSALDKKERTAFYEMYKIFEEMTTNKHSLLPRLHKIEGTAAPAKLTQSSPRAQNLQNHLTAIGWTNRDQVSYTTAQKGGYGKPDKPNQWAASWSRNPYQPFLDQEQDYTNLINGVQKAEKNRNTFSLRRRTPSLVALLMGPGTVKAVFSGQDSVLNQLQFAKDQFPNRVALKFLDWMGQRGKVVNS